MIDALDLFTDPTEAQAPDAKSFAWLLRAQGITQAAIVQPWCVRVARVIFTPSARYEPCPGVGDFAFVFAVVAPEGIVDLAAWCPTTGRIATRLGVGAMLGEEQIETADVTAALPVWQTPLGWLRNGRRGVVIVDHELSAHLLSGLALTPENSRHASELKTLRVPPPIILPAKREHAHDLVAA